MRSTIKYFSQQTCITWGLSCIWANTFSLGRLFIMGSSCILIDMIFLSGNKQQVAIVSF